MLCLQRDTKKSKETESDSDVTEVSPLPERRVIAPRSRAAAPKKYNFDFEDGSDSSDSDVVVKKTRGKKVIDSDFELSD